jgi:hypothetical protein
MDDWTNSATARTSHFISYQQRCVTTTKVANPEPLSWGLELAEQLLTRFSRFLSQKGIQAATVVLQFSGRCTCRRPPSLARRPRIRGRDARLGISYQERAVGIGDGVGIPAGAGRLRSCHWPIYFSSLCDRSRRRSLHRSIMAGAVRSQLIRCLTAGALDRRDGCGVRVDRSGGVVRRRSHVWLSTDHHSATRTLTSGR